MWWCYSSVRTTCAAVYQAQGYAPPRLFDLSVQPPGFGEKCCSLCGTPSHSLASVEGSFGSVMLGQPKALS